MLNTVDVIQKNGSSGRQPAGFDYYTGLQLIGTAPSVTGKWPTFAGNTPDPDIKAEQMFSALDATAAGIIPWSENTASTSTYLITTKGNTGDTLKIVCNVPIVGGTQSVTLSEYTVGAGDTTIALQGAAIAALINAGTVTHGFSASFTTATLTVTAPKNLGISLNTGTPYVYTIVGAFAGTLTQNVVSGTASPMAAWYYHIKEYFRVNPTGNLTVGIVSAFSSFNDIVTLQRAAKSKLRQVGYYDTDATRASSSNITGTITQLDAAAKKIQKTAPFSVIYSPNIKAISDLSTYPDQNLNTANKVQTVLSQDGAAEGALLFIRLGFTVGNIGAKLGTLSKSRVSSSDAQPIDDFNVSDGVENDTIAFGNGQLSTSVSSGLQTQLDNYRYTFLRNFGDTVAGSYWTDNKCCISATSSYAFVNDNRVSDKVARICYSTYTPLLSSELIFNGNGTLKDYTIEYFKRAGEDAIRAGMITGYGNLPLISDFAIDINPDQPVRQTSNLTIDVTIVENGIARKITVNIGFGTIE